MIIKRIIHDWGLNLSKDLIDIILVPWILFCLLFWQTVFINEKFLFLVLSITQTIGVKRKITKECMYTKVTFSIFLTAFRTIFIKNYERNLITIYEAKPKFLELLEELNILDQFFKFKIEEKNYSVRGFFYLLLCNRKSFQSFIQNSLYSDDDDYLPRINYLSKEIFYHICELVSDIPELCKKEDAAFFINCILDKKENIAERLNYILQDNLIFCFYLNQNQNEIKNSIMFFYGENQLFDFEQYLAKRSEYPSAYQEIFDLIKSVSEKEQLKIEQINPHKNKVL